MTVATSRSPAPPVNVTFKRSGDRARDLVLHVEDVLQLAVVALGPELEAVARVDQLHGDADAVARAAHAALEHRRDAELVGDRRADRRRLSERERRRARRDAQTRQLRERVEDLLGDAVAEPVLVLARG